MALLWVSSTKSRFFLLVYISLSIMAIGHAMIKSNHVDVIAYHCRGLHRAWSMNKHGFVISLQKKKFEAK